MKLYQFIFMFALIFGTEYHTFAGELVNPQLGATYVKLTDGTKSFSFSLSARIDDNRVNIENAPVSLYAVSGSGRILLGTVNTNRKGKAVLTVNPDISLPKDKEGYYTFVVQYEGNTKVSKVFSTIHVQDVFLEMSFSEKDSIKNVLVNAYVINEKGAKTAIRNVPVEFYIERLFCQYRFGGGKTDSTGCCMAEFPKNMPGDTIGNVMVIAKVVENEIYGTVETGQNFKGGNPLLIERKQKRGLGDTDAPLWMVYTLLVLLSGVWLHVLYVISLVIRINIMGKKTLKQRIILP